MTRIKVMHIVHKETRKGDVIRDFGLCSPARSAFRAACASSRTDIALASYSFSTQNDIHMLLIG